MKALLAPSRGDEPLSHFERARDHVLAPQKRLSLNPERSLQITHLQVQHVYVRGAEPRVHAHVLVHVEPDSFARHQ